MIVAIRSLCQRIARRALAAPSAPVPEAGCSGAYRSNGRATRPYPSLLSRERLTERSLEKFIEYK